MTRDTVPPTAESLQTSTQRLKSTLDKLESKPPASFLVAYIAGPFSAPDHLGIKTNIKRAAAIGHDVRRLGIGALVPHLIGAPYIQPAMSTHLGLLPDVFGYDHWIKETIEMCRRCDLLVTVPGWEDSNGSRGEVAEMQRLKRPVFHSVDHLANWLEQRKREILEA